MLSGHTDPESGAVLKHDDFGVRLVLTWAACAASPAELRHEQVTPNHVLYELAGQPLFGDGRPAHDEGFLDTSLEDIIAQLSASQREQLAGQFGSAETWARLQQPGLLGAANTVVVDGRSGYFPPGRRCGRLVYEDRTPARHVVTAECVEFFRPTFDLTRARRTVAVTSDGVAWIIDDYQAATAHTFSWQAYLRRGCSLGDGHLHAGLSNESSVTVGWAGTPEVGLHRFPAYPAADPAAGLGWPDAGSERLRLTVEGRAARFGVCVIPWRVEDLSVTTSGPTSWRATWPGGSSVLQGNRM